VSVNMGLAQLSDHFLLATVVLYALGMLAFAGDFAYGRSTRQRPVTPGKAADAVAVAGSAPVTDPARVAVPAGVTASAGGVSPASPAAAPPASPPSPPSRSPGGAGTGAVGAVAASRWRAGGAPAGPWVRAALVLTVLGLATHILGVLTRGLSEHRVPWGNMYEFVTAITCAAVIAFLLMCLRFRIYSVGLFFLAPIVLALGLCATVLFTAAGPLVPALHSYWIWIHVTAMTLAIGGFIVAAVLNVLYLLADRHVRRSATATSGRVTSGAATSGGASSGTAAAGTATESGFGAILRRLPGVDALDRLSYRTVIFAFPIWTFGVIAGAIWADEAWGRYWGWDPKETWAFITWVVYAGYLHARATAGWRGRKAAYIQLIGFVTLVFNLVGVNLWITGLHSYAGIN
jgi:cytochrome c-type biogenesis protein CcsB